MKLCGPGYATSVAEYIIVRQCKVSLRKLLYRYNTIQFLAFKFKFRCVKYDGLSFINDFGVYQQRNVGVTRNIIIEENVEKVFH